MKSKTKFKILISLIVFPFYINSGFSQTTVTEKLDKLLSNEFFESTLAAVDAYDLTNDKVVYQKNISYLMHPASNMKILTSAAGLFFLGPDYNFETTVYYKGEIDDGILTGDLYVVGGFDPEFSTNDLDYFVDAIDSLGIKEINGNIFADVSNIDSMYWGRGWMWDDDPSTDSPYLSSLNINRNSVDIFLLGTEVGKQAQVLLNPHSEYFTIVNDTRTIPPDEMNTYFLTRDWMNRNNVIIASGKVNKKSHISGDEEPISINVFRPDLYFLTLFKEALERKRIKVTGRLDNFWLPYNAVHLRTFSRSLTEVIVNLNKYSINLHAEMILYAMADKYYGKPAISANGIKVINNFLLLTGINPEQYRLVDGSGLSHYNLVSAELMLAVLKYVYKEDIELYRILGDSFPLAGVDGTLKERMAGSIASNNVKAKTGTLSGVSALSGYLTSKSGNLVAFSILMENFVNQTSTARSFQDEICKILVEY